MRWFSTACFAAAIVCLILFLSDAHNVHHDLSQASQAAQQAEREMQRAEAGIRQAESAQANAETHKVDSSCSTANGTPGVWVRGTGSGLYCFTYADTLTTP